MEYKECKYAPWLIGADGTVISKKTGKPRKLFIMKDKQHYMVNYRNYKESKTYNYYVHRLVYEHFIGEIPNGYHVHHKDHNPLNNCLNNLELATPKQNTNYAREAGRWTKPTYGEYNSMAKLSNADATLIIQDILNGMRNVDIARKYGIDHKHVSLIRRKKRWNKLWEEVERATTIREE